MGVPMSIWKAKRVSIGEDSMDAGQNAAPLGEK